MRKELKKIVYIAIIVILPWTMSIAAEQEQKTENMEDEFVLDEIVVTATRTERAVDMTSKPVTIINKEAIDTKNVATVLELLDDVPGISFSRIGTVGGQISFRGFNSNDLKSPLFIDGDRFRGRNTVEYHFIDFNRIERIEVIRGPAAAMYGTDAMTGLVNIITRRAQGDVDQPFALTPRIRSLDYSSVSNLRGTSIELEGTGNGFDILLGLSLVKADNYDSPHGEIQNSNLEKRHEDIHIGYNLTPDHRIELTGRYTKVESGYAGGLTASPGYPYKGMYQEPITEEMLKLRYIGRNKALGLEHIEASMYIRDLYTHSTVYVRSGDNLININAYADGPVTIGGKLFGVRPWRGKNTLTIGADWYRDDAKAMEQDRTIYNAQGDIISYTDRFESSPAEVQTNIGVFLHNDWDPSEKWTVSVSGREDYFKISADVAGENETTDNVVTGGMGLIYRPIPVLHFTGNVNTSYREPVPYEKFAVLVGYEANPDLEPETSITYEAGVRLRLPQIKANLTAFQSDYEDLISRQYVDSTLYPGTTALKPLNVGSASIRGVEFDSTWLVNNNWKAFMNASYLHGTNTETDSPLPYIAPLNGLIGVRYIPDSKDFYLELTDKWSIEKYRIDATQ
ncbi:MAG: TonB-dependent receptor, partial [Desulfobacteraceae bacterium]